MTKENNLKMRLIIKEEKIIKLKPKSWKEDQVKITQLNNKKRINNIIFFKEELALKQI